VQLGGLDVQNVARAVDGRPARLLDDVRERRRFVQQPQLALRGDRVRRIQKDTARHQVAVDVGDERADVARILRDDAPAIAVLERAHDTLDPRRPLVPVTLVDTVVRADIGRADVGVRQQKLAMVGSRVKPWTPCPVVYTSIVLEPYRI